MSIAYAVQNESNVTKVSRARRVRLVRVGGGGIERVPLTPAPEAQRASAVEGAKGPTYEAIVAIVRCYVTAHIGRPLEIAEVVSATGVSASTVRRAVFAETGERLQHFVFSIRLDRAHAWLSTNRESRRVSQIAAALGCPTVAIFSRAYSRRFGQSMTETRRRAVMNWDGCSR